MLAHVELCDGQGGGKPPRVCSPPGGVLEQAVGIDVGMARVIAVSLISREGARGIALAKRPEHPVGQRRLVPPSDRGLEDRIAARAESALVISAAISGAVHGRRSRGSRSCHQRVDT